MIIITKYVVYSSKESNNDPLYFLKFLLGTIVVLAVQEVTQNHRYEHENSWRTSCDLCSIMFRMAIFS